jgi:alpha-glucosidase (family GH31 glycosyl hydrolase)
LKDQRTFLLSRSTFAGSGKYVQHWLGDNHRNWDNMKWSIAGIMNFNMFGIPMVGPDVCGFFEDKNLDETEQRELCARWIELSVFYPFARQHHDTTTDGGRGGMATEPYNLGGTKANTTEYKDWATYAIKERFSYLTTMYTCHLRVHREGGTCFDPLLMHYPHDDAVFAVNQTEHTFLVADAIKVSPVLEYNVTEIESYFPTGDWVDLRTYGIVHSAPEKPLMGQMMKLSAENGINAHLRPGYMIAKEMCDKCNTTFDLKTTGKI